MRQYLYRPVLGMDDLTVSFGVNQSNQPSFDMILLTAEIAEGSEHKEEEKVFQPKKELFSSHLKD